MVERGKEEYHFTPIYTTCIRRWVPSILFVGKTERGREVDPTTYVTMQNESAKIITKQVAVREQVKQELSEEQRTKRLQVFLSLGLDERLVNLHVLLSC